jgi:hypothetical protein
LSCLMQFYCQSRFLVDQGVDTCDQVCDIGLAELLSKKSLSVMPQLLILDAEAFDLLACVR